MLLNIGSTSSCSSELLRLRWSKSSLLPTSQGYIPMITVLRIIPSALAKDVASTSCTSHSTSPPDHPTCRYRFHRAHRASSGYNVPIPSHQMGYGVFGRRRGRQLLDSTGWHDPSALGIKTFTSSLALAARVLKMPRTVCPSFTLCSRPAVRENCVWDPDAELEKKLHCDLCPISSHPSGGTRHRSRQRQTAKSLKTCALLPCAYCRGFESATDWLGCPLCLLLGLCNPPTFVIAKVHFLKPDGAILSPYLLYHHLSRVSQITT